MFDAETRTRRSVVRTSALALSGLTALAGCSGESGEGGSSGGSGESGGSDGGGTATETDGSSGSGDGDGARPSAAVADWMANVGNYESVVDETGSDAVTVAVGAESNGGAYAFDPPAVRISTGTTVVWEWTGKGAQHNVAAESGDFESDLSSEGGFTFEHSFSSAGTYRYACTPHRTLGMKGVVIVE